MWHLYHVNIADKMWSRYEPPFRFKFISLRLLLKHASIFPLFVRHSVKFKHSISQKVKRSQSNNTI